MVSKSQDLTPHFTTGGGAPGPQLATRRYMMGQMILGATMMIGASWALPRMGHAASPEIYAVDGVALGGTDSVAYFNTGAPTAGATAHALMWMGATWHFATDADRLAFEMNPRAFAPQFGGYCAFAAAKGYLVPTDPAAFTIYEGRLYLNANLQARALWLEDPASYIAQAEVNYPKLIGY